MSIRLIRCFFISLALLFCSCVQAQPQNQSFYLGLKSETPADAIPHFEKALTDSNVYIKRAGAQELAALMAEGVQLTPRTEQRMRQEIHGPWAQALNSVNDKEAALSFLLNMEHTVPEEARHYALTKSEPLLNEDEFAAVNGHYAIYKLRYNEALLFFRRFQQDAADGSREWPKFMPDIFIKYPVLINDLGRAFQYTASGSEGLNLFLQWEKNLLPAESFAALQEARFRLQFFAGRIARRVGQNEQAKSLFEHSLQVAPNKEQMDACIWYILDLALRESTDAFLHSMEHYITHWHNKNYYNDILERLLQTLAARKDWDRIIRTFNIIKDSGASIKAAYAWVIVRVMEEGYKTQVEPADKFEYLNIAYNEGGNDLSSTLYYRGLSAAVLGTPFLSGLKEAVPAATPAATPAAAGRNSGARRGAQPRSNTSAQQTTSAMQFINGFFTYHAEDHALRYILQLEKELSLDDLRSAAGALESAGAFVQVIRLVIRYTNRADYTGYTRRDLELLFPCPYKELVDKYAKEYNIAPEILFGLIRTESAFQSAVVSRSGAVGLTQLIPATAQDMAGRMRRAGGPDYSGDKLDLDDPEQNIHIGAYYLNYLNGRFENTLISLLAYNGGMNRIRRLRAASTLPDDLFMETITISETRDYGRKVMGAAEVYKALYY